jgi:S-methylmethionine-dependent homocysteine/selenocysteine methylase
MVTLTNGVALKTSLAKAKEILGEKLDISKSMHEATYQAGDSLISLISYSRTPNGVSHEEAAKDINKQFMSFESSSNEKDLNLDPQ